MRPNEIAAIGKVLDNPRSMGSGRTSGALFDIAPGGQVAGPGNLRGIEGPICVVSWGRLGSVVKSYVKKHSQVYVEGRLQWRTWRGTDGRIHTQAELVLEELMLLGALTNRTLEYA